MGYAGTIGVILYCKTYQTFVIHRYYYDWFDEYNSRLSIEDKHTQGPIILSEDPKIILIFHTSSTLFHVNLIIHTLHFVIH